jgi:excisionase family DNA binding protein
MTRDQTIAHTGHLHLQNVGSEDTPGDKPTWRQDQTRFKGWSETMLTIAEVAEILRVSVKTVRRMIEKGDLKHSRFRRTIRISHADLRLCINEFQK